ncbi:helix-hairpin-helix domain-containing protein [Candidatus Daviesbacteria bacterium]|nr:helix-hairpin-helix domain-containing protein [Candidatus Daviesbacteria bacterium]
MNNEIIDKFKLPIGLSLVGVVLIIGGMVVSGFNGLPGTKVDYPKESIVSPDKQISIDISGAVIKPGVYQLSLESRVEDAILAAGGLAETANGEYVSKYLNMAQKLSDGMKIYVPFQGETPPAGGSGTVAGTNIQSKVNINTASQAELEALPGIGPVTAAKIISGRPYSKAEDLLTLKLVSKSVFDKIKDSLVIY